MNDWKFGSFIKLIITVQILILILIGLELNGIAVPLVNQLTGFIYLTFVPGFLLLRVLKIHRVGSVKSLLFAVGLSTSSIMFLGFFMNMFLPLFGISRPISTVPLTVVFCAYVVVLSILCYLRDRDFESHSMIDTSELFSPVFLFLALIPFLAIIGSFAMNYYHSNLISMLLIVLLGTVLLLIGFNRISERWYKFSVWVIAISLLCVSSLVSLLVWGWDIQNEYYLANLVLNHSYWNYMLPDAYNSMLSVVMIAPVYHIFTGVDLDHVFKLVYPFLFSLVPLGLYKIFKTQTDNSKIAFLAVFLFMSFNTFYIELLSLSREMTAELFMVLLLLLIFDRKYKINRIAIMLLFSMSLVVSHYSLTYFFIAALTSVTVMMAISSLTLDKIKIKGNQTRIMVLSFIALFMILFTIIWYGSFSNGLGLKAIIDVLTYLKQDLFDVLNILLLQIGLVPNTVIYTALVIIMLILLSIILWILLRFLKKRKIRFQKTGQGVTKWVHDSVQSRIDYRIVAVSGIIVLIVLIFFTGPYKTWIVSVLRYLNFTSVVFTMAGLAMIFLSFHRNKFQGEYLAFSVVGAVMLISGFMIPSFEGSFNITRIFEIAFMILSPLCVIGGAKILGSIYGLVNRQEIVGDGPLKIFSIFLLIFLLFNTGFISVLVGQSIPMHLTGENTASDYYPRFNYPEAYGAQWLTEYRVNNNIYADVYGRFIFYRYTYNLNEIASNNGVSELSAYTSTDSYIYARKLNANNSFLIGFTNRSDRNRVYMDLSEIVNPKNRIFDDGDSKVYYS